MLFRSIADVPDSTLETDCCVIGAGPAGISCAIELAKLGKAVVLLEGGGLSPPDDEALDLYRGFVKGPRHYPLLPSRLRYFGGTSGHWGGWCRPLDPIDFATKAHIPHSGWPIDHATLSPWYGAAHRWLQIENANYYDEAPPDFVEHLLPPQHGFTTKYFRFSPPTRFGSTYLTSVAEQAALNCVLNATAIKLTCASDGTTTSVKAKSLDGHELNVRATHFVVAMGGIENARFLMSCADQDDSIPWQEVDWLGRGFMDHPGWSVGQILARADLRYRRFGKQPDSVMPVLTIDEAVLKRERLINCCVMLLPVPKISGIDNKYALNPWVTKKGKQADVGGYVASMIWEPSPCRTSRVTLSNQRDGLGVRRLNLHWDFNPSDFEMLDASISHLNRYLHLTHTGRLKLEKPVNKKTTAARIGNGWHHMGTTRMSAEPATGVVDEHCKIHQSPNVYVAGSSVFPSVGFSNPTLTITALSCRLAAHIAGGNGTT